MVLVGLLHGEGGGVGGHVWLLGVLHGEGGGVGGHV